MNKFYAVEQEQEDQDKEILRVKEERNELETRAYAERNKVQEGGELFKYVSEAESQQIREQI